MTAVTRNDGDRVAVEGCMSELTVYTTSWCPFSRRLVTDLNRAGIDFTDIDVDEDADAAAVVQQLNNGNRTVPTVLFADGSSLTNPPLAQVQAKLAS
jgi:mycoredoxin